jgi:hypothetical protein
MFHATMARVFRLVVLSVLLQVPLLTPASAQEFSIPVVVVSGGDLAGTTRLAPADADAFRRRVVQPPRLEEAPQVAGAPYLVTTGYWAGAVRLEDDEEQDDVGDEAHYYQDGGYARIDVGGEDAWLVLDLRQRAILDRYIRLALEGSIGEAPSTLDVLAATFDHEPVAMEAGTQPLAPEITGPLISGLAAANPEPFLDPRQPPDGRGDGFWLTVTLLEGRTLRYFFDGISLTESLGTEQYDASPVAATLNALAPVSSPVIRHEEPAGSLLWWPVMVGGSLTALGAAYLLRRRAALHRPP